MSDLHARENRTNSCEPQNSETLGSGLGTVHWQPDAPIVAGSMGTWTLTLTVGSQGIDEGGTIKIARRLANDSEPPQFDRPAESGYCRIQTTGEATLRPHYTTKGHIRPWLKCLVIDVLDGALVPGDTVTLTFGDRSGGGPGMRAQTFQESAHEIRVLVDPTNACLARVVPDCPVVAIIPDKAVRILAVAPSLAALNAGIPIRTRGEDRWGNPVSLEHKPEITWVGSGEVRIDDSALARASTPGAGRFQIRSGTLEGWSNPVEFVQSLPPLQPYWGDLHAQTGSTVGTGSEEEYFRFGREQAFLDFIGHQGNDFQISAAIWSQLNRTINRRHEDHAFVIIPGYEWSGNTPAGGDRNVFFRDANPPIFRSSHWQIPEEAENADTPAHPASELFRRVKNHGRAFTCAHVGGRYADITRYFDPEVCPLVEVVSCWGIFEWILRDALERNFVVGVMANSDGHKGRPGAEGPGAGEFGISGGLTCVLAPELTREAIFEALLSRRCYGTTGPRIRIDLDLNGHPMGWKGRVPDSPQLKARVLGAGSLEKLELYRGLECIETHWHPAFSASEPFRRIRVLWKGARHRGRGRRITWSGKVSVVGAQIESARTIAFDSPGDGITAQTLESVSFTSHTTGDSDGLELALDSAQFSTLTLETPEGTWTLSSDDPAFATPEGVLIELGSLEKCVRFQSYPEPEALSPVALELNTALTQPPASPHSAYYLKVTQTDGHMAWTSPVYLEA